MNQMNRKNEQDAWVAGLLSEVFSGEQKKSNDDVSGQSHHYNTYFAKMLVCHDAEGKKYLYDLLGIKKETSSPLE